MATLTQVPALPVEAGIEVSDKATRRRFTLEYKRRILREVDACSKRGEVGALLRREGLYSSHVTAWRLARERGELAGNAARKRGPAPQQLDARDKRIVELERTIQRLEVRAAHAEAIIEVQKKLSVLLGIPLPATDEKGGRR